MALNAFFFLTAVDALRIRIEKRMSKIEKKKIKLFGTRASFLMDNAIKD